MTLRDPIPPKRFFYLAQNSKSHTTCLPFQIHLLPPFHFASQCQLYESIFRHFKFLLHKFLWFNTYPCHSSPPSPPDEQVLLPQNVAQRDTPSPLALPSSPVGHHGWPPPVSYPEYCALTLNEGTHSTNMYWVPITYQVRSEVLAIQQ